MKRVSLAITDFALPEPRQGSIDELSGFGRSAQLGQELHQGIQEKNASLSSTYEAEVPVTYEFERGAFVFQVSGRMDGIFRNETPIIEEIKSTFSIKELGRRLRDQPNTHPYCLQLKTYGYIYWLQNKVVPKLTFILVSSRNSETEELDLELDITQYEEWLETRLAELVIEAEAAEKRAARRRKAAKDFVFPFPIPRVGQPELIQTIEDGMKDGQRMLIQAPTGLGKTVGVLYPALKEALSRGQRVVYVTPKNSQHTVAEDAVERLQETGAKIKSLTITAKSKICFKNEPLCNPEYCEYAKDHYTKVAENGILEQLAKKKKLTAKTFKTLGEKYEVCPFEIQLDAAQEADTVICDYNYVFAPRSAFGRLAATGGLDQDGKPNLVIDEAHNLPARAMDYHSPSLSSIVLEKMREDLDYLPGRYQTEVSELIDDCIQVILDCKVGDIDKPSKIEPPAGPFMEQDTLLRAFLSRYLESDVEIQAKDPVLRLTFYWSQFTEMLEFVGAGREEFFTTFHPHSTGGIVKITCCDASEMLKTCYDEYDQVVGFSATLKPFEFYTRLAGLESPELKTAEFASPFPKSRRKLLIIPQISSKFSDRTRNYPRIAETIHRIAGLKRGNYFAFFPSFDFLERVVDQFTPPEGFMIIKQERGMKNDHVQAVLDHLRGQGQPTIVFAAQGGVFSEGVDYPGEMVIGAFVVGPPLPSFDLEREEMRGYYEKKYSAGFDYAYTFPAMAKAVQAAGRVIRSETDRGLIVLMDNRFIHPSYTKSMPGDWFESDARELVSDSILKEVSQFWVESETPSEP